jgi:uncharacterized protein involved in exopolysaccharide biosynthesis
MSSQELTIRDIIFKIKYLIAKILSKWLLILCISLAGGILGYLYASSKKVLYVGVLTFVLEDQQSNGQSGLMSLATQFGFGNGGKTGGAFTGSNLYWFMKSRFVVEKALLNSVFIDGKEITLADRYISVSDVLRNWEKNPEYRDVKFAPKSDRSKLSRVQVEVLQALYEKLAAKNLSIGEKDKSNTIVTIEVRSEDELFSKFFAETLIKEVSSFYIEAKTKKAKEDVAILQYQVDSVRASLNSAIADVASQTDFTYNLNPAMNIKKVGSQKRTIDVQGISVLLNQLLQNLEIAKLTLRKETPLFAVIDNPIIPLKKETASKTFFFTAGFFFAAFFSICVILINAWLKAILKNI